MIEITFLGTSCMFPTKERNHPGILLRREGDYLLFDCGEATQKQLRIAKISPHKIKKIFITHWHGDHCLGIPGLIETLSTTDRATPLEIYGPEGSKERVNHFLKAINLRPKFEIKVIEIPFKLYKKEEVFSNKQFSVYAMRVPHRGSRCLSFRFEEKEKRKINIEYTKKFGLVRHPLLGKLQKGRDIEYKGKKITVEKATYLEKGKVFTYITDTAFSERLVPFSQDSNVLVCESTFTEKDAKKAEERSHFTARQAGVLAKLSDCKKLFLTHFSQRYENIKPLVKEAKEEFAESFAAKDFLVIGL